MSRSSSLDESDQDFIGVASRRQTSVRDSLELDRIETARQQQQLTVGSTRSRTPREEWLPLGAGKPYPPSLPSWEQYVVEFEGSNDRMHPQNWPLRNRYANYYFLQLIVGC